MKYLIVIIKPNLDCQIYGQNDLPVHPQGVLSSTQACKMQEVSEFNVIV